VQNQDETYLFYYTRWAAEESESESWWGQDLPPADVVQISDGAHPASYPMGTMGSFSGVKLPGREAHHSPQNSAEVKNTWIYRSPPPYVFMAQCLSSAQEPLCLLLCLLKLPWKCRACECSDSIDRIISCGLHVGDYECRCGKSKISSDLWLSRSQGYVLIASSAGCNTRLSTHVHLCLASELNYINNNSSSTVTHKSVFHLR
jgi:hypothetical protein